MLFFTSDRVGVGIVSWAVRAVMTMWKSKIAVLIKQSHKSDGVGVGRIRAFPFSFDSAYDSVPSLRLWSGENQIVRGESRSGGKSQSQCTFPRFVIISVLPLLLATLTTYFSLDRKRWSRKWDQNAVFTRSLTPTLLITTPTLTPSLVKTSLKRMHSPSLGETEKKKYI